LLRQREGAAWRTTIRCAAGGRGIVKGAREFTARVSGGGSKAPRLRCRPHVCRNRARAHGQHRHEGCGIASRIVEIARSLCPTDSSDDSWEMTIMNRRPLALAVFLVLAGVGIAHGQAGSLDSSFGVDGRTVTSVPPTINNRLFGKALAPDGTIVAVGSGDAEEPGGWSSGFAIARLSADGQLIASTGFHLFPSDWFSTQDSSPDATFGTSGQAFATGQGGGASSVVVQPDGTWSRLSPACAASAGGSIRHRSCARGQRG